MALSFKQFEANLRRRDGGKHPLAAPIVVTSCVLVAGFAAIFFFESRAEKSGNVAGLESSSVTAGPEVSAVSPVSDEFLETETESSPPAVDPQQSAVGNAASPAAIASVTPGIRHPLHHKHPKRPQTVGEKVRAFFRRVFRSHD